MRKGEREREKSNSEKKEVRKEKVDTDEKQMRNRGHIEEK